MEHRFTSGVHVKAGSVDVLGGGTKEHLIKYEYHDLVTNYLNKAIAGYARVRESKVEFFYDTLSESKEYIEGLLEHAYQLGRAYK